MTKQAGTSIPDNGEAYTLGPLQSGPACCEPIPAISVRNLSLQYNGMPALEKVTLDIYRGCITALIGPSGCGKTSFLSSLNRLTDLIPNCDVSGEIEIEGQSINTADINVQALRRQVGMIFQKPNPFPLSIRRNIQMPLREHGVKGLSVLEDKMKEALRDVGLWEEVKDRLDTSAMELSGGQQQRLCIARALALEPEILLMDEPCSALDPLSSAVVEDLIQSLRGRYTVVIVTHNLAQARRIANYAGFFWAREQTGTLIEFGRCKQIFESPAHALTAAYISGARG
ncbi:MAG: phosphate ABC transporter ATP-binding protein [Methylophilaceae bacterium]|nr:phosphate ABC transporter ATP-binding protein [Methylophilaceae bacterium]